MPLVGSGQTPITMVVSVTIQVRNMAYALSGPQSLNHQEPQAMAVVVSVVTLVATWKLAWRWSLAVDASLGPWQED